MSFELQMFAVWLQVFCYDVGAAKGQWNFQ